MAYYKYHVFFCTNRREDGRQCCAQCDAEAHRDYLKGRTKELGIAVLANKNYPNEERVEIAKRIFDALSR